MIAKLLKKLAAIFNFAKQQPALESYLISRNVKNAADVDYWTKRFYQREERFI
jgi:hypothetical protein